MHLCTVVRGSKRESNGFQSSYHPYLRFVSESLSQQFLIATCDLRLKQGKLRTECCLFARPLQNHCLPDATLVALFLITIALDWEMYSTAPNPPSAVSFSAQAGQTEPTPPTVLKQKSGGASLFFTLHRKVTPAVMCQQLFF